MNKRNLESEGTSIGIKSGDVLRWRPSIIGWKLTSNKDVLASIRGSLKSIPNFRFEGSYTGMRVEIKHSKGRYHPLDPKSEEKVVYSIMKEDRPNDWDEQGLKEIWGFLEDNSYTPMPVRYHGRPHMNRETKPQWVRSKDDRCYSIELSRVTDVRGIYQFADRTLPSDKRVMAVTSRNWDQIGGFSETFKAIDFRPGDPDPFFVAIISYAAAEMARSMGNP